MNTSLIFRKWGYSKTYQNLCKKVQPSSTSCSQTRQEKAVVWTMFLCQIILRQKPTMLSLSLSWTTMHFRGPRDTFPGFQLLCGSLGLAFYNHIPSHPDRQRIIFFSPTFCQSIFPKGQAGDRGDGKVFCTKEPWNTQFPYWRCPRSHWSYVDFW